MRQIVILSEAKEPEPRFGSFASLRMTSVASRYRRNVTVLLNSCGVTMKSTTDPGASRTSPD